eukprot:CAMPEP_0203650104 /NCGR_PEP_ID=MMETSP0088-20131115/23688_1 /ASSEMBLY_ACC=CAM_ASM_001087 /TAXON_ID=426623 /ORGANISM="Chaetoceros affinis, Strain CCMP159" /LENGTH=43 /DNA_ID= /DNA_START= /DNA_END= /DNA_ORIENTATION=
MSTDTTLETKTNLAAADNSTTNNTLPTYRLKPNESETFYPSQV